MTTHAKHEGERRHESQSRTNSAPDRYSTGEADVEPNASPAQDRTLPAGAELAAPTPKAPLVVFAALALNELHTGALDAGKPLGFFKSRTEAESAARAHHGAHKGSVYVHQLTLEPVTP